MDPEDVTAFGLPTADIASGILKHHDDSTAFY
jgi:hypothetical protein